MNIITDSVAGMDRTHVNVLKRDQFEFSQGCFINKNSINITNKNVDWMIIVPRHYARIMIYIIFLNFQKVYVRRCYCTSCTQKIMDTKTDIMWLTQDNFVS